MAAVSARAGKGSRLDELLEQVDAALERWPGFAAEAGVPDDRAAAIARTHRRLSGFAPN